MTKVTILGQEPKEGKRKIEFLKGISISRLEFFDDVQLPSAYKEIKVIKDPQDCGLDFFICCGFEGTEYTHFFIGHLNDGIV